MVLGFKPRHVEEVGERVEALSLGDHGQIGRSVAI
jgi:hypothetical protein